MTDPPKVASLRREPLSLPESERWGPSVALIESVDDDSARGDVLAAWASRAGFRLAEVQSGVVKPVP
jgi:hypothetical protein